MKTTLFLIVVTVLVIFSGCASAPPNELINGRTAYRQASAGPAAQLAPAELHKAHEALILAEKSFVEKDDSFTTRDLAYVAQRKAQLADALGIISTDKASKAKADADYQQKQADIVRQGKQDLSESEQRTADAEADVAQGMLELSDSEKRTADALAEIAKLTAAKEEERGLVITLSGSVLFRSGEATLLSSARVKLDQVVTALLAVKERNLIVEGHTDSQGTDLYNQDLSQRRAEAVRHYLVEQGYPADRIRARGMGEGSPIAENTSPEGLANNRRVEIIIEREINASNQ